MFRFSAFEITYKNLAFWTWKMSYMSGIFHGTSQNFYFEITWKLLWSLAFVRRRQRGIAFFAWWTHNRQATALSPAKPNSDPKSFKFVQKIFWILKKGTCYLYSLRRTANIGLNTVTNTRLCIIWYIRKGITSLCQWVEIFFDIFIILTEM